MRPSSYGSTSPRGTPTEQDEQVVQQVSGFRFQAAAAAERGDDGLER